MRQKGKLMTNSMEGLFAIINGQQHLLNPSDGQYYPIVDERDKCTGSEEPDLTVQEELDKFLKLTGGDDYVRYGVFYNEAYKRHFRTGTVLAADIICPQYPGGKFDAIMFLVAGNRAEKCITPAFCYTAQKPGYLMLKCEGSPTKSIHRLDDYIGEREIEGKVYRVLSIQTQTFLNEAQENLWVNQFFIYNHKNNSYLLIDSNEYEATEGEQKTGEICTYGPCLASLLTQPYNGNPVGVYNTYLRERDECGVWSEFHLLTDDMSFIYSSPLHKDVKPVFSQPNYTFALN